MCVKQAYFNTVSSKWLQGGLSDKLAYLYSYNISRTRISWETRLSSFLWNISKWILMLYMCTWWLSFDEWLVVRRHQNMSSSIYFYSESLERNLQSVLNYFILSFSPLTLLALTIAHQVLGYPWFVAEQSYRWTMLCNLLMYINI